MATASIKLYNSSDQEVSEFTESQIVTGGCYVEVTLSGDTWIAAGGAAPTFVEEWKNYEDWGTSIVIDVSGSPPTAGNTLIFFTGTGNTITVTVTTHASTDGTGATLDTFTERATNTGNANVDAMIGDVLSCSSGINSIKFTYSGNSSSVAFVMEVDNISSYVSSPAGNNDSGTAPYTPEATNTADNAFFIAAYASNHTSDFTETINESGSTPATWTLDPNGNYINAGTTYRGGGTVYFIASTQSARDHYWTLSSSNSWCSMIAVYQ